MLFEISRSAKLTSGSFLALVLALLGLFGDARPAESQQPREAAVVDTVLPSLGMLRPGDMIHLMVARQVELSGEYLIDSQGYVQIPGVANVLVAGLEPSQAREQIRQAMLDAGFANPSIAVQPLIRVFVFGEVRDPGIKQIEPGARLIQVLSLTGGPVETADLRRTRVIRDGRTFNVDMAGALEGSAAGRIVLYSNDVIVVPRRTGLTRENLAFIFSAVGAVLSVVNLVATLSR